MATAYVDEEEEIVALANEMLDECHVRTKIHHWRQLDSSVLVTLYRGLFADDLPGYREPKNRDDEIYNVQAIIDKLSRDILCMSLSHLTGRGIVTGNKSMIHHLLEILRGLLDYLVAEIRSNSSGTDEDRGLSPFSDPDMVTPELIDDVLDRELNRKHDNLSLDYQPSRLSDIDQRNVHYTNTDSQRYMDGSTRGRHLTDPRVDEPKTRGQHLIDSTRGSLNGAKVHEKGNNSTDELIALGQSSHSPGYSFGNEKTEDLIKLGDSHYRSPKKTTVTQPGEAASRIDELSSIKESDGSGLHRGDRSLRNSEKMASASEKKDVNLSITSQSSKSDAPSLQIPTSQPRNRRDRKQNASGNLKESERLAAPEVRRSRSFENLHHLMEDTAALARDAVQSSPCRTGGSTSRTAHQISAAGNVRARPSGEEDPSRPPEGTSSRDSKSAKTSSAVNGGSSLSKMVPLGPPRQTNRPAHTYEDYLLKYYGTTDRPPSDDGGDDDDDGLSQHSDGVVDYGEIDEYTEEEPEDRLAALRSKIGKKMVRFNLKDDSAPGKMRSIRKKLAKEQQRQSNIPDYVGRLYQYELDDFQEGMAECMEKARARAQEVEAEYRKKTFRKPKINKSRPSKRHQASVVRSRPKSRPVKHRKRSSSSSPTMASRRSPLRIEGEELLPVLLEEFPYLHLSKETLHNMWRKSARQVEQLSKLGHEVKKQSSAKAQIEEAERKSKILSDIMKKDLGHLQRMRDIKERQRQQQTVKREMQERREQSARARKYYEDYQIRMRSKMLARRTKEELIFKKLFEEGLKIQKERVRELRKYAKEQRDQRANVQQDKIDSIENFYRDQYALFMEAMDEEREQLKIKEKAQEQLMNRMQNELRKKMENEIKDLQEQVFKDEDSEYFRQLDADRLRHQLRLARYQAQV